MREQRTRIGSVFTFLEVMLIGAVIVFNIAATRYLLQTFITAEDIVILGIINGFSLFSLVVAGIGIMGIQLIAVSRRTSEIGLRIAVGATKRDIASMIMFQSFRTVLVPAVPGLLLGYFVTPVAARVLEISAEQDIGTVMLAFVGIVLFSLCVGALPAIKACRIEPIEAIGKTPGLR